MNIKVECRAYVRMAEDDADGLVITVAFDAAGRKAVSKPVEFDMRDSEALQQTVVMVAVASRFSGPVCTCKKIMTA